MSDARPPAPEPAVGPATCHAAADLARAAIGLLSASSEHVQRDPGTPWRPRDSERDEAARMLRAAAKLVTPPPPPPVLPDRGPLADVAGARVPAVPARPSPADLARQVQRNGSPA